MDVPQAHESVDSRSSVAGGRRMPTAELAQMEAAGHGFAQQLATEAAARGCKLPACRGQPARARWHAGMVDA
jgi:hypothetical protein